MYHRGFPANIGCRGYKILNICENHVISRKYRGDWQIFSYREEAAQCLGGREWKKLCYTGGEPLWGSKIKGAENPLDTIVYIHCQSFVEDKNTHLL